jgi:uncharacterized protein
LREQLELLWELQKIDLDLKAIEEGRSRYPREIQRLDEKQKIEEEKVQKEKERIEVLEKERRQKERELAVDQEKIKRSEGRMFEAKTNKEYQALLSEIDASKEANNRDEEAILRLLEEIDALKKSLSKRETEASGLFEKVEAEKKGFEEKMAHDDAAWKDRMGRRADLSKQIDPDLFRLYSTLTEKRQGIGVVGVRQETCQGCFMNVPPQMFIEAQKNNALIRCPNCNRILYWEGNGGPK